MQHDPFGRTVEIVQLGFATPHHLTLGDVRLPMRDRLSASYKHEISGCLYRADGTKIAISERRGGTQGDHVVSRNSDFVHPPSDALKIAGRAVYLGHHMGGHYGHFITEGISSFWIFEDQWARDFDSFVFHPFVFGDGIPSYMKYCLDEFGIPQDRIVVIGEHSVRFEEMVVPSRLFSIGDRVDPSMRRVYERFTGKIPSNRNAPTHIYLSRRRHSRNGADRLVANEVLIENAFKRRGFSVIFPETLEFAEQLSIYSSVECLAGISGSSLHNSVFMRPGGHVIELGDPRYGGKANPNQLLCNHLSGVRTVFIPFSGLKYGARMTMLFSVKAIERRLDRSDDPILNCPNIDGSQVRTRFVDLATMLYRAIRPTVGDALRKFRARLGRKTPLLEAVVRSPSALRKLL